MNINSYPYNKLTEYFVRENYVTDSTPYRIESVDARLLLTPNRFDLMAKWIYIEAKDKGLDMTAAREVYLRNIDSFSNGTFLEPGTAEKNSAQKYIEVFDALIEDIKVNGVNPEKSLVPVGDDYVLLDGAHRVAIAAYYGQKITVIVFPGMTRKMNWEFFRNLRTHERYLDKMACKYAQVSNNIYMACIWPRAGDEAKRKQALELIGKTGSVVYQREIKLSYHGLYNLLIQTYKEMNWTGTYENAHAGIAGKANECYRRGNTLLVVLFHCDSQETTVQLKQNIRNLFQVENHSIHITDTAEETRSLAQILYNENSRYFLNYANPDTYKTVNKFVVDFKELVLHNGFNIDDFVVDSSSVLAIWGLREARDLDYFMASTNDKESLPTVPYADAHDSQLVFYNTGKNDLIYNPDNYFYYDGIKYVSLQILLQLKKTRNEIKDRKDCKLIKKQFSRAWLFFLKRKLSIMENNYQRRCRLRCQPFLHRCVHFVLKQFLPKVYN